MTDDVVHLWLVNHRGGDPNEPLGYFWAQSEVMAVSVASRTGCGPARDLVARRERHGQLYDRYDASELSFAPGPVLSVYQLPGLPDITHFVIDEVPLGGQYRPPGLADHGQVRWCVNDVVVASFQEAVVLAVAVKNGATLCEAEAAGRVLMTPEGEGATRPPK